MFTAALGMACTFNTDLVEKMGNVVGTEAEGMGIHNVFGRRSKKRSM